MSRPLDVQLAESGRLLAVLSERDLVRLLSAAPPAGFWSRLLGAMIRAELRRRRGRSTWLQMTLFSGSGVP